MSIWSKFAIAFEALTIALIVLLASDFEFMSIDPDEAFIITGFITLILSLVFSIIGAYKTYHNNTNRLESILVIVSVPILAAIAVFTIIRLFAY